MKAFYDPAKKQFQRAGLILLFVGEVGCCSGESMTADFNNPDEHSQIGILTSGIESLSRLPNSASGTSGNGSL